MLLLIVENDEINEPINVIYREARSFIEGKGSREGDV